MDGFTETISGSTGIDCPSIVSEVYVYHSLLTFTYFDLVGEVFCILCASLVYVCG